MDQGSTTAALDTFLNSIKGGLSQFTTGNLATVLVAALSVTAGLAIAWFAYRFIIRKVSGAMKKGKM